MRIAAKDFCGFIQREETNCYVYNEKLKVKPTNGEHCSFIQKER